jgi:putative peptidoglycan lipid II flippase
VKIASPSFYSLRDSRTPVIVSVISVLVNLGLNLMLVRVMGYRGLALGTALAAIFNAGVLLWLLDRRLEGLDGRRIAIALAKILAASAAMGLAAYIAAYWLASLGPATPGWHWKSLTVFGAIGAGVVVLVSAAKVLRIAEFDEALSRVLRRVAPAR